jgi:hypothetical protein
MKNLALTRDLPFQHCNLFKYPEEEERKYTLIMKNNLHRRRWGLQIVTGMTILRSVVKH